MHVLPMIRSHRIGVSGFFGTDFRGDSTIIFCLGTNDFFNCPCVILSDLLVQFSTFFQQFSFYCRRDP